MLLRVLRLPATGVVDRLDDFLDDVEVLLFAGAFFTGVFFAAALAAGAFLAGDFLAADLDDADAERLVLVERLGFGLADLAAAGFTVVAVVFLTDAERPLVDVLLLAGDLDLAAAFAAGFLVTLRLRLAGSATSAAASATLAVGFVDLRVLIEMTVMIVMKEKML